ncbi:MAG: hemerythrin family protein, partial [Bacteriovoracaceae bacterium]|nr:hemerythrin family protein [Bacteriovoracaceae bacterium]
MPEQRKLIWKSSNNFGIKSIDQQHESLIAIVNNLFDEALSDSSKKCINKIFISLEEYVSEHFRHEEMLFERYNWYEKDEHKIQHQLLEKKLSAFKEEIFDECSQQQL